MNYYLFGIRRDTKLESFESEISLDFFTSWTTEEKIASDSTQLWEMSKKDINDIYPKLHLVKEDLNGIKERMKFCDNISAHLIYTDVDISKESLKEMISFIDKDKRWAELFQKARVKI